MEILEANLVSETGSKSKDGPSYERVYNIKFTGEYSCAYLMNEADELPKVGNVHPDDDRARVGNVKPELASNSSAIGEEDAPGLATYTVSYEPKPANEQGEPGAVHPLDRPPIIKGTGSTITHVPTKSTDEEPKPLVNSAGDMYPDIPEVPLPKCAGLTITRNEPDNPLRTASLFSHTTNDARWYGVDIGNAMIGLIEWERVIEEFEGEQVTYYTVTYPITLRADGWAWKSYDNGYRKTTDDGENRTITDDVGNTSPEPCLLDGEGSPLPNGEDPVVFPEEGYNIVYKSTWNRLNLPNPFD